jgi:hypothetical protein
MNDYTADAAEAKDIIDSYGVFGYVQISRSDGVLDPVAGTNTGTATITDLTAVDLNVSGNLVGDLIERTDRMVIMSSDKKPLMSDVILIGGVSHKMVQIFTVSPAGTDVIYKVVCRA